MVAKLPDAEVAFAILAYVVCSSVALVFNKVTLHYFPVPGLVFVLQLAISASFIGAVALLGLVQVTRGLNWADIRAFLPYIASFIISLYSSGRALASSNVETVVVFRACSPLCVSILDWLFLGRELPSARSALSLCGVAAGAIGYVLVDSRFELEGLSAYGWVSVYLCGIVFEMTYGKRLVSSVQFASPVWGSVFLTNAMAVPPMLALAVASGEPAALPGLLGAASAGGPQGDGGLAWLAASCAVGLAISWSGWNCRSKTSATAYTLLGVVCKLISIMINYALWEKHARPTGLAMLLLCLLSSSLYKQADLRRELGTKE